MLISGKGEQEESGLINGCIWTAIITALILGAVVVWIAYLVEQVFKWTKEAYGFFISNINRR
tara:strand:+ start:200 stop:385 length:186 start_codon:yes stop_codon:yes gene_type:complete